MAQVLNVTDMPATPPAVIAAQPQPKSPYVGSAGHGRRPSNGSEARSPGTQTPLKRAPPPRSAIVHPHQQVVGVPLRSAKGPAMPDNYADPNVVFAAAMDMMRANGVSSPANVCSPYPATTAPTASSPVFQGNDAAPPAYGARSPPKPTGATGDDGPKQLIVNFLSPRTTDADLRSCLEPYGRVDIARVVYDRRTGRSKGYGFVYYHRSRDAVSALIAVNGIMFHGRRIKVSYAEPQRPIIDSHTPSTVAGENFPRQPPSQELRRSARQSRRGSQQREVHLPAASAADALVSYVPEKQQLTMPPPYPGVSSPPANFGSPHQYAAALAAAEAVAQASMSGSLMAAAAGIAAATPPGQPVNPAALSAAATAMQMAAVAAGNLGMHYPY